MCPGTGSQDIKNFLFQGLEAGLFILAGKSSLTRKMRDCHPCTVSRRLEYMRARNIEIVKENDHIGWTVV